MTSKALLLNKQQAECLKELIASGYLASLFDYIMSDLKEDINLDITSYRSFDEVKYVQGQVSSGQRLKELFEKIQEKDQSFIKENLVNEDEIAPKFTDSYKTTDGQIRRPNQKDRYSR